MRIFRGILTTLLLLTNACYMSAQSHEWKLMHDGNTAFRSRNYEKAQSLYLRVLKESPNNARAYFNLGDTYLAKGDVQLADSLFNKAAQLEKNPQVKSMAFHNRGYIRQTAALHDAKNQQKLLREAIECYKQALRLNPRDNDTRYNLVLCQRQLKESPSRPQSNKQKEEKQQEPKQRNTKNRQQPNQANDSDKNKQSQQQTEQYINLARQAELQTRQRINGRQPRQKSLDKNW